MSSLGDEALEHLQVELVGPDNRHVPRRPGDDHLLPERLAELRDVVLERSQGGAGSSSPHRPETSRSVLTGRFAFRSNIASSARGFSTAQERLVGDVLDLERPEEPEAMSLGF